MKTIKNKCPKCGSVNTMFVCSMRALNCSGCMEFIKIMEPDEKLVDIKEEKQQDWEKETNK